MRNPICCCIDLGTLLWCIVMQTSQALIEKLTGQTVMEINWDGYVEVGDRLKKNPSEVKDAILLFKKRLNHRDPHVVQNTIELLDFCWKNGPVEFRKEVCSKKFIQEIQAKADASEQLISRKMCEKVKEWAMDECKKDPSLSLVESLYRELCSQGKSFSTKDVTSSVAEKRKKEAMLREEEERQLREAIQASLKVTPPASGPSPLYSKITPATISASNQQNTLSERKVRALYDFPAQEDNEMSFSAGDTILVIDDSNQHWWRARLNGQEGLIPAQFVEDFREDKPQETPVEDTPQPVTRIDESVLLRAIEALQACDPAGLKPDPEGLEQLEMQALAQAPLIDAQLAHIDRMTNMLAKVDMSIRNVLAEYDMAVQNTNYQSVSMGYPSGVAQHQQPQYAPVPQQQVPATSMPYPQGSVAPQMPTYSGVPMPSTGYAQMPQQGGHPQYTTGI